MAGRGMECPTWVASVFLAPGRRGCPWLSKGEGIRARTKSQQEARSRVHHGWSTCLQLCGGTPRLLWCRYPEATQICVAPLAALSSGHAATVRLDSEDSFRLHANISCQISSANTSDCPCCDFIFETKLIDRGKPRPQITMFYNNNQTLKMLSY